MIETLLSRSKLTIAKWQGRLLCSSVDPAQEAATWVAKNASRVHGLKQVIVLGAGCGYHLAALQKAFPEQKILVIERSDKLADLARKENALELPDVQIMTVESLDQLKRSLKVQRALQADYTVLKFSPAWIVDEKFYQAAETLLLGRNEEGFRFLFSQRREFADIIRADRVSEANGLISIKTIESALQPVRDAGAVLMLKALRELVN